MRGAYAKPSPHRERSLLHRNGGDALRALPHRLALWAMRARAWADYGDSSARDENAGRCDQTESGAPRGTGKRASFRPHPRCSTKTPFLRQARWHTVASSRAFEILLTPEGEEGAANALRVNDVVLLAPAIRKPST